MKSLLVMLPLMLTLSASAQPGPDTLWTRTYGWSGNDTAFSLQQTQDGGFILGGTGTIPGAPTQTDGFLIKTDSLGHVQAARNYGGPGNDGIYSVIQLADGGYAAAGYLAMSGGRMESSGFRTNPLGDTLWTWVHDVPEVTSWSSCVAEFGDTLLLFTCTVRDLATGLVDVGRYWFSISGSSGFGGFYGNCLPRTSVNFICSLNDTAQIMGGIWGTGDDSCSAWAALWGEVMWLNWYGGFPFEDEVYGCAQTGDGFLLAGRSFAGTFLCKTDFAGTEIWLRRYVNPYSGTARAIMPAIGGGYVIAGTCPTPANGTDMYLAKINDVGDILWQGSYGGAGDEQAFDVVQTSDGGFVLAGMTDSWGSGGTDWYLVKTQPDPQLSAPDAVTVLPLDYRINAFPNPFNSSTTIAYDLPRAGHVSLRVFDLLSREVAALRDGMMEAGSHRVTFDGRALASGIYFARLDAGAFSQTRKLMLLK
jgi:hypothetical protein